MRNDDRHQDAHIEWHRLTSEEAARRLNADPACGLTEAEASRRLETYGPNRLPGAPPPPRWKVFLRQFKSVLILVLLAAALLSLAIGDMHDAMVIAAVVLFNAGLGYYQEQRAERVLDALRAMLAPQANVRRGGEHCNLASDVLVPGDIVLLESGDRVPADGRLVGAHTLEIDEASLTGESCAVAKHSQPLDAPELPLAERSNLAFTNTVVTRGRGELLVTATGLATEVGRMVGLLASVADEPTPLQNKLDQLGKVLAGIALCVIAIILAMGIWRGDEPAALILTAVALAVAAIPEGLPAVVTVTLAIGMYAMARRGAIVKRLAAVETLGSTTVICTDKTGTLTLNRMTVRAVVVEGREVTPDGLDAPDLLTVATLCNDAHFVDGRPIGDPTETALLALAETAGFADRRAERPRLAELPFDAETKMMATFHADGDAVLVCVKGAPEVLRTLCRGGDWGAADTLAERALRVLALAWRRLPAAEFDVSRPKDAVRDLTLAGLVGIVDPPRPEAKAAIAACRRAGIAVKMITGDHRVTAAAIAAELGIEGEVVTGPELERMDEAELEARVEAIGVFARVAPEHKMRIVAALKRRGGVVAMTGDGVNDAPALKAADIGVAMGVTGTDVAREAAAMVLTDDNFATIAGAVRQGRTIYDNIVKFLRFQLSTNVGALLAVFAAPLLGLPSPFTPIQILWVNIIMDGPPAMALAFDPPRRRLMDEPPRPPDEPILGHGRLLRLGMYGATMAVGTLLVLAWALPVLGETQARTLAFTTFVLFQFFNVFNARVGQSSALNRNLFRNRKLWLALTAVVALQVVAVHWPPAQAIFQTAALGVAEWAVAAAVAASVVILDELRKLGMRLFWRRG